MNELILALVCLGFGVLGFMNFGSIVGLSCHIIAAVALVGFVVNQRLGSIDKHLAEIVKATARDEVKPAP